MTYLSCPHSPGFWLAHSTSSHDAAVLNGTAATKNRQEKKEKKKRIKWKERVQRREHCRYNAMSSGGGCRGLWIMGRYWGSTRVRRRVCEREQEGCGIQTGVRSVAQLCKHEGSNQERGTPQSAKRNGMLGIGLCTVPDMDSTSRNFYCRGYPIKMSNLPRILSVCLAVCLSYFSVCVYWVFLCAIWTNLFKKNCSNLILANKMSSSTSSSSS